MSKETGRKLTSMDGIWEKINKEATQEWENKAVETAVDDPKIQTAVGLLPHCTGALTSEGMTERLEGVMAREYDAVPPARYEEVFAMARTLLVLRELEVDGEA